MKPLMRMLMVRGRLLLRVLVLAMLWFLAGCGEKEKPVVYSMRMERTKATFYADQKLPELMNMPQPPPGTAQGDAWDLFAKAFEDAKGGNAAEAKKSLKSVLSQTNLDTRFHLWAWAGLRSLGEEPDATLKTKLQGVVAEIPTGGSVDTCAVYVDGSVRYIGGGGEALTEVEKTGSVSSNLIRQMLDVGQSELAAAPLITNHPPLVKGESRLTLLTFGGTYAMSDAGARKGKWKLPDKISQNMNQLSMSIQDDLNKAKTGR